MRSSWHGRTSALATIGQSGTTASRRGSRVADGLEPPLRIWRLPFKAPKKKGIIALQRREKTATGCLLCAARKSAFGDVTRVG